MTKRLRIPKDRPFNSGQLLSSTNWLILFGLRHYGINDLPKSVESACTLKSAYGYCIWRRIDPKYYPHYDQTKQSVLILSILVFILVLHHWQKLRPRLRHVFFGSVYQSANHNALSPHGGARGIRMVLIVTGTLWLLFVLSDNLVRPWQRHPKSWKFFQGPRELDEEPSQERRRDVLPTSGRMGQDLGVMALAQPYLAAEDTTPVYIETNSQGFRAVRSTVPFAVALCGDSFASNNSFADSLAKTTGLSVGNQAIAGRGTLAMARFLEDYPVDYQRARIVIWESTERGNITDFTKLRERRRMLRETDKHRWQWRQSLLWPANLDIYLNGSSLSKPFVDKVQKEIKWALLKRHTDLILLGRRDLPAGTAPMLYLGSDEAIRSQATSQQELDSIAMCIAEVDLELKRRGQQLVFTVAPEKSIIYPDRLPVGLSPRNNYIIGLNKALQERGIRVVDLSVGLRKEAAHNPATLYYYTADTHWTPKGMQVASQIITDSLIKWQFIPNPRSKNLK